MSEIIEFKCPSCGGQMEFNSNAQRMKCLSCGVEIDVDYFNNDKDQSQGEDAEFKNACDGGEWSENELNGMKVYSCLSCGGEIIAEETAGTSLCPYCGNRVVMKGQFSGGLKPDLIIPFKHDKKRAKEAYLFHLKGKPFLPKVFERENHIDEIKGIYVPFWIFDADVVANCTYKAEQISRWTKGDKQYIETKYFDVERGMYVSFSGIPTDASKLMDDTLMEAIEPFNVAKAVPFNSAYLSGYMADRFDVDVSERFDRAKERIRTSAIGVCRGTVSSYQNVTTQSSSVRILNSGYRYALFPVWILNTTYRGKKYTFAMNGQTGKMIGDLPANKLAFLGYVLILGPILAIAFYLFELLVVLAM